MKKITNNITIIVILIFIANQYLVAQISDAATSSVPGSRIVIQDNAAEGEVVAAVLPKDSDTVRPYKWQGQQVTLSAQVPGNGYDMLVAMNNVQLTDPAIKSRYDDFSKNVYHPCCDVAIGSCGCKHAVAARGLIKYLLTQGYSDDQINEEVFLWNRYWWPKHYATVAVYMNSQGTNPATISPRDWLGPQLSTIRAGRKMRAALGR